MPQNSFEVAEAINRSFEPDDAPPPDDDAAESIAWVNDCMNDWLNA